MVPAKPLTPNARTGPLWAAPALIAALAFIAVVAAIDPGGDYPDAPQGPGLTIDEAFNVEQGVRLVMGLRAWFADEASLREIFGDVRDIPNSQIGFHNPDHPPLGRLWLGLWHDLTATIVPSSQHAAHHPFITACARVGSAAAFALTVFLCGWIAAKWYGSAAGVLAAISLVLMPRVFGHAHLAALETCIGLAYFVAVVSVARLWSEKPPSWGVAALCGVALGAAMLTKIQGALVPIPVTIWALWHWRIRAIKPLAIWGLVGLAVFFLLWPWLWMDPFHRFLEYAGRTTDRIVLYVWYFGHRYADRDVPRHYAAVLFLTTVPLGLQALGFLGLFRGRLHFSAQVPLTPGPSPARGEGRRTEASSGTLSDATKVAPREVPAPLSPRGRGVGGEGAARALQTIPNRSPMFGEVPPWKERHAQLVLGAIVFPVLLFSLPHVAVYDGARLFLVVFPLWAIFVGRGGALAWSWLRQRLSRRVALAIAGCFLAAQLWGTVSTWPCFLSYYNIAIGGLRGADRLGMELDYWSEAVTRNFLEEVAQTVPEGAHVEVSPILLPNNMQIEEMFSQSPILRRRGIVLSTYQPDAANHAPYVIVFRRQADLSPPLQKRIANVPPILAVRREGVILAGLWKTEG
jgi:4-amino-4-deoxy-L-arabinose transferase-like glycosyltransferase